MRPGQARPERPCKARPSQARPFGPKGRAIGANPILALEEGGVHPPLKDGSCLALSCLALSCLSLSCLALTCLVMLCLALPCLALPCPALPEGKPTEAKDAMASLRNPKERPRDAQRRSKGGQGTMREAKRRPKALFEELLCSVPRYACFSQHATKSP